MKLAIGTKIHKHVEAFHRFFKEGNVSWLRAGRELIILKNMEVWKVDGSMAHNWRTWVDHCLLISGTTADRLIRISDKYGKIIDENPAYADCDPTKLDMIPNLSSDGRDDLLEWVEKCRNLSCRALKDEITESKKNGQIATDVCLHDGEMEPFNRCKICNKWIKVGE